jgi:mycofactocin system transcriptional regulator
VRRSSLGRPLATSHGAIEEVAFTLFDERGFDETTMDDIAQAVGIGRRTLFRYYPSKNDILWGQFDDSLETFAERFRSTPDHVTIGRAIRDAVVDFNTYPDDVLPRHRRRMRLLLDTPQLLAHSELRYAAWRAVVVEFVARRLDVDRRSLAPVAAGRVALALSLSAYEVWLAGDRTSLTTLIASCFDEYADLFALRPPGGAQTRP